MIESIVTQLVGSAVAALVAIQPAAMQFGLTIATAAILFALAINIGGGGGGAAGLLLAWIVKAGLVIGGFLTFAPYVLQELVASANELATLATGTGVTVYDVLDRGSNLAARAYSQGVSGSSWNPSNTLKWYGLLGISAVIYLLHLLLTLVVAVSLFQLYVGFAGLLFAVPFMFIPALSGIGGQVIAFGVAGVLRLVIISIILRSIGDLMTSAMFPGETETLTWSGLMGAMGAMLAVTFISVMASTWASVLGRGSVGSTGATALALGAAGMGARSMAAAGAGGARAGAARGGSAAAGSAGAGGSPSPSTPPGGGAPGGGSGRGGGGGSGEIGVQTKV